MQRKNTPVRKLTTKARKSSKYMANPLRNPSKSKLINKVK